MRRLDAWIFAAEDPRRLASLRIGLCAVLAYRLAVTDFGVVAGQPAALFQPVSYMKLFSRMPSAGVATTLQVVGVAAAAVAAIGVVVRLALPVALACSLVLDGMLNSAGRVVVGDAVLTLCVIVLVASGRAAGEAWTPFRRGGAPPPGPRYGWPVRTAMIAVSLAYFFAGFEKWRHSGLAWVTSDNLRWILYASSDGHAHPNHLALFIADRPTLAHVFAAGTILLETCFPLVLLVPRLRWVIVPSAIAMHIGVRLALNLEYSAQWLTALVVFVNWPVAVAWVQRAAARVPLAREAPG